MHRVEVHAASGMIVLETIAAFHAIDDDSRSSPRAAKICWSSIE
jgi:hypothetical protein